MVDFSVRSQGLSSVINSSNTINLDWSLTDIDMRKVYEQKIQCILIITTRQKMKLIT